MAARFAGRGKFLLPSFGGLGLSDRATPGIRTYVLRLLDMGQNMEESRHHLGWCSWTPPLADDQEGRKERDDDQDDDRCQADNPIGSGWAHETRVDAERDALRAGVTRLVHDGHVHGVRSVRKATQRVGRRAGRKSLRRPAINTNLDVINPGCGVTRRPSDGRRGARDDGTTRRPTIQTVRAVRSTDPPPDTKTGFPA